MLPFKRNKTNTTCSYGDLPEDLRECIFERLPVKSLLRFRSISKYWYSRIASPDFIRNHSLRSDQKVLIRQSFSKVEGRCNYSNNDVLVYTLHSPKSFGYIKPVVEFEHRYTHTILGSCNGILCVLTDGITLWNFSIRRKLTLPRHPSFEIRESCDNAAYGFGYDPVTDDYKVVVIPYSKYIDSIVHNKDFFIYSLKTNSWDSFSSATTPFVTATMREACFFNGTLHWVLPGFIRQPKTSYIMTFNLSTHAFGTISLPNSFGYKTQITTINGSLAVVYLEGDYNRIWVLREYDNVAPNWSVYFEVKTYRQHHSARVLQPIINGKILMHDFYTFRVYNPQTGLITEPLKFKYSCNRVMENYVESLELLDKGTTTCGKTISSWMKDRKGERILVSELLENEYSALSDNFECVYCNDFGLASGLAKPLFVKHIRISFDLRKTKVQLLVKDVLVVADFHLGNGPGRKLPQQQVNFNNWKINEISPSTC